ncbi:MAG: peptidylprolyl isomerase [Gammaproteobacteria bacterium]
MQHQFTRFILLTLLLFSPFKLIYAIDDEVSSATEEIDSIIAIVNENVITESELEQELNTVKQQLIQSNVPLPSMDVLRRQVLQSLIDASIQLQLAKDLNLTISNEELDQALEDIAARNNLTLQQLHQEITSQGSSFTQFRESIRKEMTISRLQQEAVRYNIIVTDEQIDDYIQTYQEQIKANLEFHVRNILIPISESPTPNEITQAEQKANALLTRIRDGADFSQTAVAESGDQSALQGGDLGWRGLAALPEIFSQEVIHMEAGDVVGPIRASNGFHLIKLEGTRTGEQNEVTLTHVRQILLKLDPNKTSTEIKSELSKLRKKIIGGEDFVEIAEQYSEDYSSANKGGDLGWIRPEQLPPALEDEINRLKPDELSQPIQSQNGWHLLEVLGRRVEDDSERQIRATISQLLYQRRFDESVQNWLQELRGQIYIDIFNNNDADEDNETQ